MKYPKNDILAKLNRPSLCENGVIFLCLMGMIFSFLTRELVYFRDYAITFEGGYRVYLGQIPFKDFFSPVGPGSFLLPALFFKLFSPNWTVFLVVQQFENCLFIVFLYLILVRLRVRVLIRCISLSAFTLLYLLLQTHPWYNTTAILLLFAVGWLSLIPQVAAVICAGLLVGLAVLTKQDVGLLAFLIGGFFTAVLSFEPNSNQVIPSEYLIRDKGLVRLMLKRLLIFFLSVFFVVFIFAEATDPQKFIYWFNYGQTPHERRSFMHLGLLWGLIALLPGAIFNNRRLFMSGAFFLAASITRKTSGLEFTHYYYVAFIPIFVDEFLNVKNTIKNALMMLFLTFLILVHPVKSAYYVLEAMAIHQPEHFFFNYRKISGPLVAMPNKLDAFSTKLMAPQATIDALLHLKTEMAEWQLSGRGSDFRVLNMTELTPIYAELNVQPPKKIPLWFHSKITLFQDQVDELNAVLKTDLYDLILIQGTHEGLSPTYTGLISVLDNNLSYDRLPIVKGTPSNLTCTGDCQGDIFIYKKR